MFNFSPQTYCRNRPITWVQSTSKPHDITNEKPRAVTTLGLRRTTLYDDVINYDSEDENHHPNKSQSPSQNYQFPCQNDKRNEDGVDDDVDEQFEKFNSLEFEISNDTLRKDKRNNFDSRISFVQEELLKDNKGNGVVSKKELETLKFEREKDLKNNEAEMFEEELTRNFKLKNGNYFSEVSDKGWLEDDFDRTRKWNTNCDLPSDELFAQNEIHGNETTNFGSLVNNRSRSKGDWRVKTPNEDIFFDDSASFKIVDDVDPFGSQEMSGNDLRFLDKQDHRQPKRVERSRELPTWLSISRKHSLDLAELLDEPKISEKINQGVVTFRSPTDSGHFVNTDDNTNTFDLHENEELPRTNAVCGVVMDDSKGHSPTEIDPGSTQMFGELCGSETKNILVNRSIISPRRSSNTLDFLANLENFEMSKTDNEVSFYQLETPSIETSFSGQEEDLLQDRDKSKAKLTKDKNKTDDLEQCARKNEKRKRKRSKTIELKKLPQTSSIDIVGDKSKSAVTKSSNENSPKSVLKEHNDTLSKTFNTNGPLNTFGSLNDITDNTATNLYPTEESIKEKDEQIRLNSKLKQLENYLLKNAEETIADIQNGKWMSSKYHRDDSKETPSNTTVDMLETKTQNFNKDMYKNGDIPSENPIMGSQLLNFLMTSKHFDKKSKQSLFQSPNSNFLDLLKSPVDGDAFLNAKSVVKFDERRSSKEDETLLFRNGPKHSPKYGKLWLVSLLDPQIQ